jgi:ribosomal protein L11 methyltransferase
VVDLDLAELTDQFDLVIANIIHNTLIELAEPLTARVAEHGFLVLAGILSGQQVENILKTYCALGLKLVKEKRKEEWSALCLVKG